MNAEQVREAARLLSKIDKLKALQIEVAQRSVEFIEGDRIRAIGPMQLEPRKIDELAEHLHFCAQDWFNKQVSDIESQLIELEVEL